MEIGNFGRFEKYGKIFENILHCSDDLQPGWDAPTTTDPPDFRNYEKIFELILSECFPYRCCRRVDVAAGIEIAEMEADETPAGVEEETTVGGGCEGEHL